MACENPKRIINRSRAFLLGIDKTVIEVPCGKCEGCLTDKRNEWWIRARQEIIDCLEHGGRVFFPTFTYTSRCLPKHFYRDKEGKLDYFPCFDHSDKDRYLNSFRKQFEREGITTGFKYLWVSEYGEINTCRPHYHALFFFDSTYSHYTDFELESRIKSHWALGRVDANDELGMKVNPIYKDKAASYVSKYTTKDLTWYDQPRIKKFMELKGKDVFKGYKDILPKKFCSKGFGKGLTDVIIDSKNPTDYFTNGIELFMSDGSTKSFNIPRYVYDKLMFRVDPETHFKEITPFGRQILDALFEKQIQDTTRSLKTQTITINLANKLTKDDLDLIMPNGYNKDVYSLVNLIKEKMAGRSFEQLAIYKKVFRDLTITDNDETQHLLDVFQDVTRFRQYASRIYNLKNQVSIDDRNAQDWTDEPTLYNNSDLSALLKLNYNNLSIFKGFDEVLDIISTIQRLSSTRRLKIRAEQEHRDRDIKRQLKIQKAEIRTLSRTQQIARFY